MKLNIKFRSGYKYVSFEPTTETNEIIVDSFGDRKIITDKETLEKFTFFFKNIDFSLSYTEYYQDFHEDQTHLCMNCVDNLERMDFHRFVNFVNSVTSIDKRLAKIMFFKNNKNVIFAMKDHDVIALYGDEKHGFVDRINRNDFLYIKPNEQLKALYVGGSFKPVFESLL